MFFRKKKSGKHEYLQIVENRWENGKTRQQVVATLGRPDQLQENGKLAALLQSGARFAERVMVLNAHRNGDASEVRTTHIGPTLVFQRRRGLFSELELVFFDTTSIYFEGEGGSELGQYGHSKDHRPDHKQMVIGGQGRPLCCKLWPGNVTDVKTLIPIVDRLRRRFRIGSISLESHSRTSRCCASSFSTIKTRICCCATARFSPGGMPLCHY